MRGKAKGKTVCEYEFALFFRPSSRCRDLLPAGGEKGNSRTVLPKGGAARFFINLRAGHTAQSLSAIAIATFSLQNIKVKVVLMGGVASR